MLLLLALAVPAVAERLGDRVVVRRDGIAFGVQAPAAWRADLGHAGRFGAHVVFYQDRRALKGAATLILLRVNTSTTSQVADDLQRDMDDYRKRFPDVAFHDLDVSHPEYRCVAKEFTLEKLFHEYLTYVSPGTGRPERFAAALNTEAPASPAELEAYRTIVGSLALLER
jgi:hypothetical protein